MSGFGIRALKKVQEEDQKQEQKNYVKYIVVGESSYGLMTFYKLNKKYPGQVKFISKNPFLKEDLEAEWKCSLNSIRSEDVANSITGLNPRFEVFKTAENVHFYKDSKFHVFGGRAKPHEVKENEVFFTEPAYNANLMAFFDSGDVENLDSEIEKHQLNKIIASIELTQTTDLADQENFRIETGEFESYVCEKLFWCESPKKFLALIKDKSTLPDNVYSYCAGIHMDQGISVYFECDRKIYDDAGTLVLPQSMTHEWGSFILDVEAYNPDTNTQNFKALTFVGEDDLQEEDLAKKIKLMKRVIERVLPELSKARIEQTIKFSDEYYIYGMNDGLSTELKSENVQFLGHGAPINVENPEKYQYLARGIYAIMTNDL